MNRLHHKHSTSTEDDIAFHPSTSFNPLQSWTDIHPHTDRLVNGPGGNKILCDSPISSTELPPYAAPDDISNHCLPSVVGPSKHHSKHERVKPKRVIGNYTLISTLGSGSMGKVRLAVHNTTGEKLAVKIVPRKHITDSHKNPKKQKEEENREIRTIREASIMLLLNHPFIVSLKEMILIDPYYYMFMEYVNGGQLLDYIISHGKLKEKQARRFTRQIVSALDYCHRNSIVHRDLKIENILISEEGNIKIIDFGLSNLYSPRSQLKTFCGSLYFAAPELLNAKEYIGPEVDVWSLGVVLYVLVCGKVPFDDQNLHALHDKIMRGIVDYPSYLSTDCKSLLMRMLVTNPAHRASISEIIIHTWLNKGYDGPVDNFLPDRVPLTLPVDMNVIKGMTGFELGTEEEIKQQLETIVSSEDYQLSAKTLATRTAETHRNRHPNQIISRLSPHTTIKRTYALGNDDPESIPSAYHPLVSIYYLVKEKMEREESVVFDEEVLKSSRFTDATEDPISRLFTTTSTRRKSHPNEGEHLSLSQSMSTPLKISPTKITSNSFQTKLTKILPRRMTLTAINVPLQNNHQQLFPSKEDGTHLHKGTADEHIKPVFLKGLFSVTTTSTKHPSVIRADLIRVLERTGVKWRESVGRFECVHVPSIDMNKVTSSSDCLPTVPVPDLIVRFEIYIVKVPWLLGMHGLQFRRVSGDPWQYKNMCSRILAELKL